MAVESGFEVVDDRHHTSPYEAHFPRHIPVRPLSPEHITRIGPTYTEPLHTHFLCRFYTRYLTPGNRDAVDENEWPTMSASAVVCMAFTWRFGGREGKDDRRRRSRTEHASCLAEKEQRERRKKTGVAEDGTCRVRWFRSSAPELWAWGRDGWRWRGRKEWEKRAVVLAVAEGSDLAFLVFGGRGST